MYQITIVISFAITSVGKFGCKGAGLRIRKQQHKSLCFACFLMNIFSLIFTKNAFLQKNRRKETQQPVLPCGGRKCALHFFDRVLRTKDQGNTPDAGKRHNGINDTGKQGARATADPRNRIKAEQPDRTPIEGAYHNKDQGNTVNDSHSFYLFSGSRASSHNALGYSFYVFPKTKQGKKCRFIYIDKFL